MIVDSGLRGWGKDTLSFWETVLTGVDNSRGAWGIGKEDTASCCVSAEISTVIRESKKTHCVWNWTEASLQPWQGN